MGYGHFHFDSCTEYQRAIATTRIAKMLHAYAFDEDGPQEIASEAPVDGWDDIVEFAVKDDALFSVHYQVKRQHEDFASTDQEAFAKLFRSALQILDDERPYDGLFIHPDRRDFFIVLPGSGIVIPGKGTPTLELSDLRSVAHSCTMNAWQAIGKNKGIKLPIGQRDWLHFAASIAGKDYEKAARVLSRLNVSIASEIEARDSAIQGLRGLFEDADLAYNLIMRELSILPPEGRLTAQCLITPLIRAHPKATSQVISLQREGNQFWCLGLPGPSPQNSSEEAAQIVKHAWHRTTPFGVRVCFAPDDEQSVPDELRLAVLRLLLHATARPTHVKAPVEWCTNALLETGKTMGGDHGNHVLDADYYQKANGTLRIPPRKTRSANELATALEAAMDEALWKEVRTEYATSIPPCSGERPIDFAQTCTITKNLSDPFGRLMRCWMEHDEVNGTLRAGPNAKGSIAVILAALAVLERLGCHFGPAPDNSSSLATLGEFVVRAIAVTRCSRSKQSHACGSSNGADHARDIVKEKAIVLLAQVNPEAIYLAASRPRLTTTASSSRMDRPSSPALLLSARTLLEQFDCSEQSARDWFSKQRENLSGEDRDAFSTAMQDWKENDAA